MLAPPHYSDGLVGAVVLLSRKRSGSARLGGAAVGLLFNRVGVDLEDEILALRIVGADMDLEVVGAAHALGHAVWEDEAGAFAGLQDRGTHGQLGRSAALQGLYLHLAQLQRGVPFVANHELLRQYLAPICDHRHLAKVIACLRSDHLWSSCCAARQQGRTEQQS